MTYKFLLTYAINIPGNGVSVSELTHSMRSKKNPSIKYPSWNLSGHKIKKYRNFGNPWYYVYVYISCGAHIDKRVNASHRARRCHILKTQLRCYRRCDFKTQMRFQNADAISKRRCDFQNADAISKRRCDFKTQMRFQNADAISKRRCVNKTPGYLYCECNRSWIYLGDAYHNKLYTVELRI